MMLEITRSKKGNCPCTFMQCDAWMIVCPNILSMKKQTSANGFIHSIWNWREKKIQLWNVATTSGKKGNIQMYQIDAWQWFQLNWIKCIWKQIETMVFTYISCLTSTKRLLMICSLHIGVRIQSWPQESFTMLLASLVKR